MIIALIIAVLSYFITKAIYNESGKIVTNKQRWAFTSISAVIVLIITILFSINPQTAGFIAAFFSTGVYMGLGKKEKKIRNHIASETSKSNREIESQTTEKQLEANKQDYFDKGATSPISIYVGMDMMISNEGFEKNIETLTKIGAKVVLDNQLLDEKHENTKIFIDTINSIFSKSTKKPFVLSESQGMKLLTLSKQLIKQLETEKARKQPELENEYNMKNFGKLNEESINKELGMEKVETNNTIQVASLNADKNEKNKYANNKINWRRIALIEMAMFLLFILIIIVVNIQMSFKIEDIKNDLNREIYEIQTKHKYYNELNKEKNRIENKHYIDRTKYERDRYIKLKKLLSTLGDELNWVNSTKLQELQYRMYDSLNIFSLYRSILNL